jgi:hypothetical protein
VAAQSCSGRTRTQQQGQSIKPTTARLPLSNCQQRTAKESNTKEKDEKKEEKKKKIS